ncbi:hypothetical protein Tco_0428316 [Tanacetum coccineum]
MSEVYPAKYTRPVVSILSARLVGKDFLEQRMKSQVIESYWKTQRALNATVASQNNNGTEIVNRTPMAMV